MDSLENKELEPIEEQQKNVAAQLTETKEETAEAAKDSEGAAEEAETETEITKETILSQLQSLLEDSTTDLKEQVDTLKTRFYRLYRQEQQAAREAWEQLEEKTGEYQPVVDEIETQFKHLLDIYKQQRAEARAKQEALEQQNLLRKQNIIEQMKAMSETEDADVSGNLQKMRELRDEWKTIGNVPASENAKLWKEYNACQERFYDLVKINNELREYDFKKNLELKNAIIEKAEALKNKEEVVEAFRQLQQLHDEWANIGPVARELREDIWNRFKEASTIVNKRHNDYFEQLHKTENENLEKKQAIIDKLQEIDVESIKTSKEWDEVTENVQTLQAEWRTIGFAPKKQNQQIYEQYRSLCDKIFNAKKEHYSGLKNQLQKNLEKKRALLKKAEELKDSTEWKDATEQFRKIQKEWKETGAVARKYSDEIWQQFSAACDHFFEQKKAANQDVRSEEKDNLLKKKNILEQIEALEITDKEATLEKLHQLIADYNGIGFVPYREKDKLQKRFHEATDRVFEALHVDARNRRLDAFKEQVEQKDENALMSDRRRLLRQYEALQQEIKTAENNILFFTANNKKGNKLVEDMQHNIDKMRSQLKELEQRINLIDEKL